MARNVLTHAFVASPLCAIALVACEVDSPGFTCSDDGQCVSEGTAGVCESTGACSFPDGTCEDPGRRYGGHAPPALRDRCVAIPPFEERFEWLGLHASTLPDRSSNTVWWRPDVWDARGRTAYLAHTEGGFHIDVRKSSDDLTDGRPRDDRLLIGGDGSPGVGIMHVEDFGTVSARLRNPGVISAGEPLVVEFHANRMNTIGDHWEVVLTPRDAVVGAEHAAVALWGLDAPADSVAISLSGETAYPCQYGWQQELGLRVAMGGEVVSYDGPDVPGDPTTRGRLARWQLRFYRDHIEAWSEGDEAGVLGLVHTFPAGVPWDIVHVHLVGVGNAAAIYPDDDACGNDYSSRARDIAWKAVRVNPLLYAATLVHPRQQGVDRVPSRTGWIGHDIRDIQRYGVVDGVSQPNAGPYVPEQSYAFCTDESVFGCTGASPSRLLEIEIPAGDLSRLAFAQLNYDVMGEASGLLYVNDEEVGALPNRSLLGLEPLEWQRRAVAIPVGLLRAGTNWIRIDVEGNAQFARVEVELARAR